MSILESYQQLPASHTHILGGAQNERQEQLKHGKLAIYL
jgi:hypothetical protein